MKGSSANLPGTLSALILRKQAYCRRGSASTKQRESRESRVVSRPQWHTDRLM